MTKQLQQAEIQKPKTPKVLPLDVAKAMPVEGRKDGRAVAFGYGRVSSDEQKDGFSEANQRANIEWYCQRKLAEKGVSWGGFFCDDDGVSAYSKQPEDRPAFREILIQAKAGDYLVIDKVDRLFRRMIDYVNTLLVLNRMGLVLVINDMNGASIQSDTPMGDFVLHLQVSLAQLEAQQISKRTKAGFHRKFLMVPGIGFDRPDMGTDWKSQPKECAGMPWVPNFYERDIMRFCYEARMAGKPLREVALLLEDYIRQTWKGKIPKGCRPPSVHDFAISRLVNREAYILDAEEVMRDQGLTYQEAFETIGVPKFIQWGTFYKEDLEGMKVPRLMQLASKKTKEQNKKTKTDTTKGESKREREARTKAESKAKRLKKLGWA